MDFLKELSGDNNSAYAKYMKNAIYKVPSARVLKNTMDIMEGIFSDENFVKDRDAKGDLYEYLLSKLSTSGTNGQFRTPKHIINMMVELMKPTPEDKIIDPACGTAGFLASSVEYLMKNHKDEIMVSKEKRNHFNRKAFSGNDTDTTMLGISAMNLMLHNVEEPNLHQENSLTTDYTIENEYSISELEIPLPPKPIQIKIANALDKAQELIDNRKAQIEKYDELLQSMFLDMFGDPVSNPKGWEVKKLGEILNNIDSGWSPKCSDKKATDNNWGSIKIKCSYWW